MGPRVAVLMSVLSASVAFAEAPMKQEADINFSPDDVFQRSGGVQFFYTLVPNQPAPEVADADFQRFRPLDVNDRWSRLKDPTSVMLSRLVYTVDKDVSFFTERRARDINYINAVARQMDVTANDDGSFRVGKTPSNTFQLQFFDEAQVKQSSSTALDRVIELAKEGRRPDSIVFQENTGFARVLGRKTAAASVTWTSHYSLGKGRTRVTVFTMSYLHNLPPFFLGGEARVLKESTRAAIELIDSLRAYREG
jgi:hypothetical protein